MVLIFCRRRSQLPQTSTSICSVVTETTIVIHIKALSYQFFSNFPVLALSAQCCLSITIILPKTLEFAKKIACERSRAVNYEVSRIPYGNKHLHLRGSSSKQTLSPGSLKAMVSVNVCLCVSKQETWLKDVQLFWPSRGRLAVKLFHLMF